MIDLINLAQVIKERRKEKKWTQIDLANYARVSRNFIRKLESAEFSDISFVKLCQVLDLLGLTLDLKEKKEIQINNNHYKSIEEFLNVKTDKNKDLKI